MNIATIGSLTVSDKRVNEIAKSPETIQPYKQLASAGYSPAMKIAPIAYGYMPISLEEVFSKLSQIGDEPIDSLSWGNQRKEFAVHEIIRDEKSVDRDSYEREERIPVPGGGEQRVRYRYTYWGSGSLINELLGATRRNNPQDGLDYVIGIKTERLDTYKGLIPPENAELISKALETGLFAYVEIWSPYQATLANHEEHSKRNSMSLKTILSNGYWSPEDIAKEAEEKAKKLLEDPVAVGYVITNPNDCKRCIRKDITSYDMSDEHKCNRVPYFINAWDEDVILGENMQWLLAG